MGFECLGPAKLIVVEWEWIALITRFELWGRQCCCSTAEQSRERCGWAGPRWRVEWVVRLVSK